MAEKSVTLSQEQYESLLARIQGLEANGKGVATVKPKKKIDEQFGTLRLWEGMLLIDAGQVKENPRPTREDEKLQFEGVFTDGSKEKTIKVDYLPFLQHAPYVRVKILKTNKQEKTVLERHEGGGGIISKESQDGFITEEPIALEVTSWIVDYEVQVTEGEFEGQKFIVKKGLNF